MSKLPEDFKIDNIPKEPLFFPSLSEDFISLDELIMLIATAPEGSKFVYRDKNTINISQLHKRRSIPKWSNDFKKELEDRFPGTPISLHVYSGLTDSNKSFSGIHRDEMGVLLVQQIGSISISFWKEPPPGELTRETFNDPAFISEYTLNPGDAIFFPKGTWHLVRTHGRRATYSYGIGG